MQRKFECRLSTVNKLISLPSMPNKLIFRFLNPHLPLNRIFCFIFEFFTFRKTMNDALPINGMEHVTIHIYYEVDPVVIFFSFSIRFLLFNIYRFCQFKFCFLFCSNFNFFFFIFNPSFCCLHFGNVQGFYSKNLIIIHSV